ncbi:alpha-L-rhamnosidase C-terminal domain-containing protein [Microbacterium sp.]|uniref:alpha-L-rhamnosidase C-terminal domain-containing protein n=1 Tax=Microbacterium sp. TaxID=51671 RepID=UPI002810E38C|nr:alpha-L-rhamnosidase C-terminal domain-containing protein [Microbacterium sp.]
MSTGNALPAAAGPSEWQDEVLGTGETDLVPEVVAGVSGDVTNATALVADGSGSATLTWDGEGQAPYVILDYGPIVGGLPYFTAESASGTVGVRMAYSESLRYVIRKNGSLLVKPAAAGDDTVYLTSTSHLAVGQSLVIGSGDDQETVEIVSVGLAAQTSAAFAPIAAGATHVEVTNTEDFPVGSELLIGTGAALQSVTVTEVGRPSNRTPLAVDAAAGDTNITVGSGPGWQVGDVLAVNGEPVTVTSVGTQGPAGSDVGVTPLKAAHPAGAPVVFSGAGVSFAPAAAEAFPAGTTIRTPRTGVEVEPLEKSHPADAPVTSTPGVVAGDDAGFLGAGVGSPRSSVFKVTGAGTYATPANALQGGIRFHALTLTTPGTVTISKVGVESRFPNYAADDYRGWFLSSDETLNDIWYTGAYTVDTNMVPRGAQNSSSFPVILDGAKRDRRIWAGDLFHAGRSTYTAFGYGAQGSDYVSNAIDVLGARRATDGSVPGESANWTSRPPVAEFYSTAYSLYFPIGVVDYVRYSGDLTFGIEQYDRLKAQMDYNRSLANPDGLIVTTDADGRDWDFYDGGRAGTVTATNVLYYRALTEAVWLARHLIANDPDDPAAATWATDTTEWDLRAAQVKESINATLFDPARGVYKMSNVDTNDRSGDAVPQDANVMAILWGVAPEEKVDGVLAYLKAHLWGEQGPQPFSQEANNSTLISTHISGFELAARFEAGNADDALTLIKTLWARMADPSDPFYTGAFWENHQQNGDLTDAYKSLAHSWASGPTWGMSAYLLGVKPVEPGFATWTVQPHPADLHWSKGSVPTPHGAIDVSWAKEDGVLDLDVSAPDGTAGEVWVPRADGDGTTGSAGSTYLRTEDGYDVYRVAAGGVYSFRAEPPPVITSSVADGSYVRGTGEITMTVVDNDPHAYHAQLYTAAGRRVPTIEGSQWMPTTDSLTIPARWEAVPDGRYYLLLSARSVSGGESTLKVDLTVDNTRPGGS